MHTGKKVSDMTIDELFEHFKGQMKQIVMHQYQMQPDSPPEPVVFIGIKSAQIQKLAKHNDQIRKQVEEAKQREADFDIKDDQIIHVLMVPLGPFFQNTGNKFLDMLGKKIAKDMVVAQIRELQKDNVGDVMFTLFVSEAHMLLKELNKEQQNRERMGEDVYSEVIGDKRIADHDGAKEIICMQFETRIKSQLLYIPINRIGELKEYGDVIEMPIMNRPGVGIFSGFLHSADTPLQN